MGTGYVSNGPLQKRIATAGQRSTDWSRPHQLRFCSSRIVASPPAPLQQPDEAVSHAWPFRSYDRVAHRVARNEVGGHAVCAKNALELPSDTLQCCAGASVSRIRVEADAEHTPDVEGMLQHEQLRLGVDAGANG